MPHRRDGAARERVWTIEIASDPVLHAIRDEMAHTLLRCRRPTERVSARRVIQATTIATDIAGRMQTAAGWSEERKRREIEALEGLLRGSVKEVGMHRVISSSCVFVLLCGAAACATAPRYDVVIRGGAVYDGSGGPAARVDVGIRGDQIADVGDLSRATAALEIDARGLAVAPGFINMLSWATESLIHDGRSQSDIRQGVTLEGDGRRRVHGTL